MACAYMEADFIKVMGTALESAVGLHQLYATGLAISPRPHVLNL